MSHPLTLCFPNPVFQLCFFPFESKLAIFWWEIPVSLCHHFVLPVMWVQYISYLPGYPRDICHFLKKIHNVDCITIHQCYNRAVGTWLLDVLWLYFFKEKLKNGAGWNWVMRWRLTTNPQANGSPSWVVHVMGHFGYHCLLSYLSLISQSLPLFLWDPLPPFVYLHLETSVNCPPLLCWAGYLHAPCLPSFQTSGSQSGQVLGGKWQPLLGNV